MNNKMTDTARQITNEESCAIQNVSCSATFKGTVTKDQLYIILDYIDDMKQRGFVFEKHDRTDDMVTGNTNIQYVLAKHGS